MCTRWYFLNLLKKNIRYHDPSFHIFYNINHKHRFLHTTKLCDVMHCLKLENKLQSQRSSHMVLFLKSSSFPIRYRRYKVSISLQINKKKKKPKTQKNPKQKTIKKKTSIHYKKKQLSSKQKAMKRISPVITSRR